MGERGWGESFCIRVAFEISVADGRACFDDALSLRRRRGTVCLIQEAIWQHVAFGGRSHFRENIWNSRLPSRKWWRTGLRERLLQVLSCLSETAGNFKGW